MQQHYGSESQLSSMGCSSSNHSEGSVPGGDSQSGGGGRAASQRRMTSNDSYFHSSNNSNSDSNSNNNQTSCTTDSHFWYEGAGTGTGTGTGDGTDSETTPKIVWDSSSAHVGSYAKTQQSSQHRMFPILLPPPQQQQLQFPPSLMYPQALAAASVPPRYSTGTYNTGNLGIPAARPNSIPPTYQQQHQQPPQYKESSPRHYYSDTHHYFPNEQPCDVSHDGYSSNGYGYTASADYNIRTQTNTSHSEHPHLVYYPLHQQPHQQQLQPPNPNSVSSYGTQPQKCRQLPCRTFISAGSCPYGERCVFLHDQAIASKPIYIRSKVQLYILIRESTFIIALIYQISFICCR
jgi:hypothetical protein